MAWNAPVGGTPQRLRVPKSIRFASNSTPFFLRTFAGTGNLQTWTWSGWVKRCQTGAYTTGNTGFNMLFGSIFGDAAGNYYYESGIRFTNTDNLEFYDYNMVAGYTARRLTSWNARDMAAWAHIVGVWDSSNAAPDERMRVFVNGLRMDNTSGFGHAAGQYLNPALNLVPLFNQPYPHGIGMIQHPSLSGGDATQRGNHYMSEVNFVDGLALDASAFGYFEPSTNMWMPKKYQGGYGATGFHLTFADDSTTNNLGLDSSGLGNHFTVSNMGVGSVQGTTSVTDTPTDYGLDTGLGGQVRGNYAIMNVNDTNDPATMLIVNGGTYVSAVGSHGPWRSVNSTMFVSMYEDFYCEVFIDSVNADANGTMIGVCLEFGKRPDYPGLDYYSVGYQGVGTRHVNGTATPGWGAPYGVGDTIGVRIHANGVSFYKNGVLQGGGQAVSGWGSYGALCLGGYYTDTRYRINFGSRAFTYPAPAGSKVWCTHSLPEPAIRRGDNAFLGIQRYGTGAPFSVKGGRFRPEIIWTKNRTDVNWHIVSNFRSGPNVSLYTNEQNPEGPSAAVTAFNGDGYESTAGADPNNNTLSQRYTDYMWRRDPRNGVDIVSFTGTGSPQTIQHGIGLVPSLILVKNRSWAASWCVYHSTLGGANYMFLDTDVPYAADITAWNNTNPTASAFTVGSANSVNQAGAGMVAFVFADIPGFSKAGYYIGNGSVNGPFIWTGFRPKFILARMYTSVGSWWIRDTIVDTYNPNGVTIFPDLPNIETYVGEADIMSNGFKMKTTDAGFNTAGQYMIYYACAEAPAKYARAR